MTFKWISFQKHTNLSILLGGFRPFLIENKDGKVLWEQFSQGSESMRPYFIIPGQEKKDFMKKICQKMDLEAKNCEKFTIDIDGTEIKVIVEWHLGLDGKLIEMSTGLSK